MNPYFMTATCSVCGCEGPATSHVAAASFFKKNFVNHRDPRVCASNLAQKKQELEKRELKIKEAEEKLNGA